MAGTTDPAIELWSEIEAAEQVVGSYAENPIARARLNRLRRSVRPGGASAGDAHSIARFRERCASIVASVS